MGNSNTYKTDQDGRIVAYFEGLVHIFNLFVC